MKNKITISSSRAGRHPKTLPFSQLWAEEEKYLAESASKLPEDSVIVELGTAQGGSAYIFSHAAGPGKIRIFSYDPAPSKEAYRHLRGLGVEIIAKPSSAGALMWGKTCGKPIDLLFIDASHTLENVHADFRLWLPHLRPGGRVLFHDYDRPERGGASHLGVRVFLDGLLGADCLTNVEHVGRILAGNIRSRRKAVPRDAVFAQAWRRIGLQVERACKSNRATDDLTRGFLFYYRLLRARSEILKTCKDRQTFFKWEEYLEMLDHCAKAPKTLEKIFFADPEARHVPGLSRICARELLRLSMIAKLREAVQGSSGGR